MAFAFGKYLSMQNPVNNPKIPITPTFFFVLNDFNDNTLTNQQSATDLAILF